MSELLDVVDEIPPIPLSNAAIELRADGYSLDSETLRHIVRVTCRHIVGYRMELERQEMAHMPEDKADE